MTKYWNGTCPICEQGNLVIERDTTNNRLVLHCDECEWVFLNDEQIARRSGAFNSLVADVDLQPVSDIEEIRAAGWEKYARHHG